MSVRVYGLLGIPGSGRRAALADLLEHGGLPPQGCAVLLPSSEGACPEDAALQALAGAGVHRGAEDPRNAHAAGADAQALFVIFPGTANPVDLLEKWRDFLVAHRDAFVIGRIITLVHSAFLQKNPGAAEWYEACIHFSDVVLLSHREEAGNRWVSDFEKSFRKRHFPCLFEPLKKSGLRNPAAILDPEPRRMSLAFDPWEDALPPDLEIEVEIEGDAAPGENADAAEEEDAIPEDPYLERMPGGRRRRKIPDIRKFLTKNDED